MGIIIFLLFFMAIAAWFYGQNSQELLWPKAFRQVIKVHQELYTVT